MSIDKMSNLYNHHQAPYDYEKIFENLLLLQDHYANDPCANCILKHLSLCNAYSIEALTLDEASKVMHLHSKVETTINRHIDTVIKCTVEGKCKVKNPKDMDKMIQEIRSLRREIGSVLYGMDSDIVHDITRPHEHKKDEHDMEHS